MSSATRYDPQAGRSAKQLVDLDKIARLGMSPRQQALNENFAYYRCVQYDARRVDWDGGQHADGIEHESIATAGFIPPGFYDGGQGLPLKFRRPTAPYHLVRVIVDRFTGLLFSERRHPQLRVEGDEVTEDFVAALAEAARLWPAMIQARTLGGSMGTVAIGFQFIEGRPVVEVHDPRWVVPDFADRATHRLRGIEKRYMFPMEERDPQSGAWVNVWYWYRRVIDEQRDVLWKPQIVGDGEEPLWHDPSTVEAAVEHGLGFCPVVWVQNDAVLDDIDGDPDCQGIFDNVKAIDALIAQANGGVLLNCDPTVVAVTPDSLPELAKGSNNCIKLTSGTVGYMEISGLGPKAAVDLAEKFRAWALEVAQCVLEHPDNTGVKTATEVERAYSSMLSKADKYREQYGERCVKPLMEMMVKAARKVTGVTVADGGQLVRGGLDLPERITKRSDGTADRAQRKLGTGGLIKLQWPGYFEPSLQDIDLATRAASAAKATGLIDDEHASKFVAEYYRVEDVAGMIEKAKQDRNEEADRLAAQSLEGLSAGIPPMPGEPPQDLQSPELPATGGGELKLTPSDLGIIVTVNEARSSIGLSPMTRADGSEDPDGHITIAEFKAKHEQVVSAAASATEGVSVD